MQEFVQPLPRPGLQEQLWGLLQEDRNRVLLLAGPAGSGKRVCARALARHWLCMEPKTRDEQPFPSGCGQCHSCVCVQAQTHPDWVEVFPEGNANIPVDRIRQEVCLTAHRSPQLGKRKVYILDADALSEIAQNILLKTLEEAGEAIRLILLTTAPERLLETVRSRALLLRLPPLRSEALLQLAKDRGVPETNGQEWALQFAQGNPGQFLHILESEDWQDELEELGTAWLSWIQSEGTALAEAWKNLFALLDDRTQMQARLENSMWIWDLCVQPSALPLPALQKLTAALGPDVRARAQVVKRILGWIQEAQSALEANVNRELALTRLMLQIRKERQNA